MTAPVRVLVVDDEPYITDVVSSALAFEGFATEETSTVAGALAHARAALDRPDLPAQLDLTVTTKRSTRVT